MGFRRSSRITFCHPSASSTRTILATERVDADALERRSRSLHVSQMFYFPLRHLPPIPNRHRLLIPVPTPTAFPATSNQCKIVEFGLSTVRT
ncbi:hypothetical protein K439DRAFT_1637116 [Ramaria rubella]|nr:hypothetical protein K439DRAFT_1637116 [Ramaria rubella]